MKILYIHHEYSDRRAKYAEAMRSLGHDVDTLHVRGKKKSNQVTPQQVRGYDIVWTLSVHYLAYGVITEDAIDAIKQSGTKLITYTTLAVDVPLETWLPYYALFDWVFFHHRDSVDYLCDHGVNAGYMPIGFYPDQYSLKQKKPIYDITFMGNPQTTVSMSEFEDLRVKVLNRLRKFNIVVFGDGFKGKLHPGIPVYPYSTHKEQVEVYSKSKINLDVPYLNSALPEYRGKFHIKNRLFEVPATGNFLLTADCDEFRGVMGDDACGYYEPDYVEEAVGRYLADDQLRQQIARRGHEVVQNHTFEHRFRDMFNIMGIPVEENNTAHLNKSNLHSQSKNHPVERGWFTRSLDRVPWLKRMLRQGKG